MIFTFTAGNCSIPSPSSPLLRHSMTIFYRFIIFSFSSTTFYGWRAFENKTFNLFKKITNWLQTQRPQHELIINWEKNFSLFLFFAVLKWKKKPSRACCTLLWVPIFLPFLTPSSTLDGGIIGSFLSRMYRFFNLKNFICELINSLFFLI